MSQEIGWGDKDVSDGFNNKSERFKSRPGWDDLIRVITNPIKYYSHFVKSKMIYITCSKSIGQCLGCERGVERKMSVACLVVHIGQRPFGWRGEYEAVGKAKAWLVNGGEWNAICDMLDANAKVRVDGVLKHDFIIGRKDERAYPTCSPTLQETRVTQAMVENLQDAKATLNFFLSPTPADRQAKILAGYSEDNAPAEPPKQASTLAQFASAKVNLPAQAPDGVRADIENILAELPPF